MGWSKLHPYEDARQHIRQFLKPVLGARHIAGLSTGLFPFNGSWLTEAAVRAQQKKVIRADQVRIVDLMIVASVVLAISAALMLLVAFLL